MDDPGTPPNDGKRRTLKSHTEAYEGLNKNIKKMIREATNKEAIKKFMESEKLQDKHNSLTLIEKGKKL